MTGLIRDKLPLPATDTLNDPRKWPGVIPEVI